MAITWDGNFQIKTGSTTPQSSHGLALALLNNRLYMAYVGSGGKNLWYSYIEQGQNSFTNWQGNKQIEINSKNIPLSSDRPALAVLNGILHMVYAGEGGSNLWWSWFDGTTWQGNIPLGFSADQPQPSLTAYNGQLYLAWHHLVPPVTVTNPNGSVSVVSPEFDYIYYSVFNPSSPFQAGSWLAPRLAGSGGRFPTLGVYASSLYMILSQAGGSGLILTELKGDAWTNWVALSSDHGTPESSGGAGVAVYEGSLYVVYPGQGGANLWYLAIDSNNHPTGNIQIKTSGSTPETSAPVGVALFNDALCVAYKGESSDNIWFAYSPI